MKLRLLIIPLILLSSVFVLWSPPPPGVNALLPDLQRAVLLVPHGGDWNPDAR